MTIQEMIQRKQELGYSNAFLSELSGVPLGTVQKIFSGATASPRRSTRLALERVLACSTPSAGQSRTYPSGDSLFRPSMVCDPHAAAYDDAEGFLYSEKTSPPLFDRQGTYTLDDYYALPDDLRVELIDGVFFVMNSPTTIHQLIGGYIYSKFVSHVAQNQGTCVPFISPVDVQLDRDNRTMLEPDVVIVCNRDIIIRRCIYGAPDLVIEVLSPSTRRKDMIIKLNKYMNAGVREFWLIDPDRESVTVFDFEHDEFPIHYSFDDTVPVRIWEEKCSIDFREVRNYVGFIYQNEEKQRL